VISGIGGDEIVFLSYTVVHSEQQGGTHPPISSSNTPPPSNASVAKASSFKDSRPGWSLDRAAGTYPTPLAQFFTACFGFKFGTFLYTMAICQRFIFQCLQLTYPFYRPECR